ARLFVKRMQGAALDDQGPGVGEDIAAGAPTPGIAKVLRAGSRNGPLRVRVSVSADGTRARRVSGRTPEAHPRWVLTN
ncbi:MAG: hypothetical protein M3O50_04545, partial [Myxococcota bacterium]|nr:hypothetical protein [Myxococcota bacterium]